MPIVRIQATILVNTGEAGIEIDEQCEEEDDVCDTVYGYFQSHADELADLIKQQCDELKDYQDVVEVEFEEWG
jgi:hypothetical protein